MFFCTGVGRKNVLLVEDVKSYRLVEHSRINVSWLLINVFLAVIIEKVLEDSWNVVLYRGKSQKRAFDWVC